MEDGHPNNLFIIYHHPSESLREDKWLVSVLNGYFLTEILDEFCEGENENLLALGQGLFELFMDSLKEELILHADP